MKSTLIFTEGGHTVCFQIEANVTTYYLDGGFFFRYNRTLSFDEMCSIVRDPFQIFSSIPLTVEQTPICTECRYFNHIKSDGFTTGSDYCEYPTNLTPKHDWRGRWSEHIKHPRKLNKDNKCIWFEHS